MSSADASRSLIHAPVGKTLWEMTWPVIFGVATLISFNVVDTFFISLLGTDPLAAVSFTFPVTFTPTLSSFNSRKSFLRLNTCYVL